jgi:hypothetical protein
MPRFHNTADAASPAGQILTPGADAAEVFLSGALAGQTHEH